MKKYERSFPFLGDYTNTLLSEYMSLKNSKKSDDLERIMNKYSFNYSMSIHNAIYYLLGQSHDLLEINSDPLLWPGVTNIVKEKNKYILKTTLGEVRVSKASSLFKNTSSNYIFNKPLMGECYQRSYDFIKENRGDYQVVLSYMPNLFYGGHYHAYLENDNSIIDIAANSYYSPKEDSSKILNGRIIKTLNYKQIKNIYNILLKRIPELKEKDDSKLLTLALYYDYKNNKK